MYVEAICPICGEVLELYEDMSGNVILACECCGYVDDCNV